MRRTFVSVSWLVAAVGAALPWIPVWPSTRLPGLAAGSSVLLLVSLLVARVAHRAAWSALLTVVALGVVAGTGATLVGDSGLGSAQLEARDAALLATQAILAVAFVAVGRRRLRSDVRAIVSDGLIVGMGAWIVLWVLLLQPSLDGASGLPVLTLMRGATLALLSVVIFLVSSLVFSEAVPTAPVVLGSSTALMLATGQVMYLVNEGDRISMSAHLLSAPFLSAAALASAMFLHPGIRSYLAPAPRRTAPPLMVRLVTTTASLVVPVILLAVTDPDNTGDRIVRTVSVTVLAAVVMLRVIQSVRANASTQADLVHNATTDPLTGLPNRAAMLEHIATAIQDSWGTPRQPAVLFIDVDRFKNINDSLGHSAGDDVLLEVARRLSATAPVSATVGRISGDEFVLLDPRTESATQAVVLAENVLDSLREPLGMRQGDMFVSASIGVAMAVRSLSLTADEVLRHADTAMYRAKAAGRNCIAFFDDSMVEHVTQRLDIETALYRALEKNELRLVHQPIVDISLGLVVGFESLMRWDRGTAGTVSPAEFIPIAEETGTIVPLGSWALLDALNRLRSWVDTGVCTRSTTVSVNVSARQLHDPTFVSVVTDALSRSGVPADQLWLEVTESVMISEPTQALSALRALNSIGVRIAIDDFGTGYSSLSMLQRFPVQRIKIDRAFVRELSVDPASHSIVRTILAMASALGADVVAEGVETQEQLEILATLTCDKAQGYLISHPVPTEDVPSVVSSLQESPRWRL